MLHPFEKKLGEFVARVLCRHIDMIAPGGSGYAREKVSPKEVHAIFDGVMATDTIDRLRTGMAISPAYIIAFANRLGLNGVDSSELFIRWGESFLGCHTYRGPDTPQGEDQPNRRESWERLLGFTRRELVVYVSQTPTAHHRGSELPAQDLRNGLTQLAKSQGKQLIDLREGDRKAFKNFLEKGVMIRPDRFNAVINKCLLRPPGSSAPRAHWQAHFARELTADKLRAHYVEAALSRHLLAIPAASWGTFELDVHPRLSAWVLACYEQFDHKGSPVNPYYLVQKTVIRLDGIGHGARPLNSENSD